VSREWRECGGEGMDGRRSEEGGKGSVEGEQ
jgi:hypothetical protein